MTTSCTLKNLPQQPSSRVAILGSTNGTSSQLLLDKYNAGKLDGVEIVFIFSDRKKAGILERATKNNIKGIYFPSKNVTRLDYDKQIDQLLVNNNIDLVLLIGYMKLMSPWFVNKWLNKVMNIHPSLLPAFAGGMDLNVHEAVLQRGCKLTGVSLMFIDEGADTGPIISQRITVVENDDTPDTLKAKVQTLEKEMILDAVLLWANGKIRMEGTIVKINP